MPGTTSPRAITTSAPRKAAPQASPFPDRSYIYQQQLTHVPRSYGVTENTPPLETRNLAYELAYWQYGLNQARTWKQRLGAPVPEHWTTVASNLAPLPTADDGLYTPYEGLNSSWWDDAELSSDPRSLSMLRGILPSTGTPSVDEETAKKTADKVHEVWGGVDEKVFGWGRPVLAINAARLGEPERAVGYLTAFDYWVFDDAGFAERGGNGESCLLMALAPNAAEIFMDIKHTMLTLGSQVARLPRSLTGMLSFFMLVGTAETL